MGIMRPLRQALWMTAADILRTNTLTSSAAALTFKSFSPLKGLESLWSLVYRLNHKFSAPVLIPDDGPHRLAVMSGFPNVCC